MKLFNFGPRMERSAPGFIIFTSMSNLKLFESKKIRSQWDAANEKWYFSVQDVVEALTDSADVKQYIKKTLSRDPQLKANWGTICTLVEMEAADGKKRKINASDTQGILRLIQSIPSPKAEPFKQWLAQVGYERIEETQDPELSIDRAMQNYLRLGYSQEWINLSSDIKPHPKIYVRTQA